VGGQGVPQKGQRFERKLPNEGLMRANPYGIMEIERQGLGLKVIECS